MANCRLNLVLEALMKRSLMTLVALSFPILFAACGDDDDDTVDAGPTAIDASDIDASGDEIDAGEQATCESFAGCTEFEELGEGETITITGTAPNFEYSPKCVRVTEGATIVIPASGVHPLQDAACSAGAIVNSATASTTAVTWTAGAPGIYGFFCTSHGAGTGEGTGQVGAIEVVAAQ
jgi:plastocyanin